MYERNHFWANALATLGAFVCMALASCSPAPVVNNPTLLPAPVQMQHHKGSFLLKNNATIGYATARLEPAARYLAGLLSTPTGYTLQVVEGKEADICLDLAPATKEGGYTLQSTTAGVVIKGHDYAGVVNGLSTLRQLFAPAIETKTSVPSSGWAIPCVTIADEPAFEWRGMMLDVSRHFFTKEEVKELLDVMALYKLNKFHWHLTDDQGWRIEIKQYPLLTNKGAWRTFDKNDRQCMQNALLHHNTDFNIPTDRLMIEKTDTLYGGFYTQEDIKEVVSYAAVRGIDVIPEIDMPGHFLEAISHYKGLSCFEEIGWGELFSSPICPGKESALEFCKNIYKEVFQLFPYQYVHIGGDEVDMSNWQKCPDCRRRMRQHHLKNEHELHAWFIKDMEKFFSDNGKQMIGWDEILEGGLSQTATVMWWRTWAPDVVSQTTAQGNRVICTPNAEFYLDYQEDKNSLRNIYNYPLLPQGLSARQKDLVLGVQGNLWAEGVPSRRRLLYQAFPRLQAIAELGWSQSAGSDWEGFYQRLLAHLVRLDVLGINYRMPALEGFYHSNVFLDKGVVNVTCADSSAVIRYTTDGTMPHNQSTLYTGPMEVSETTHFTFRTFRANGKPEDVTKTSFLKEDYAPAVEARPKREGLQAVWHAYKGSSCKEIAGSKVNGTYHVPHVMIPQGVAGNIGLLLTGFICLPKDDIYTFFLTSDDGSVLKIGTTTVVDNDGDHSPRQIIGQHALKAGLHPIELAYFDSNGGMLQLSVCNSSGQELPLEGLYRH